MTRPNVVVVVLDSLRADHVGCYGSDGPETPAIDALAADEDAIRCAECCPEALPTIPARTALLTGQRTLPYRPWQPLTDEDVTLPEILGHHGYATSLVTDTYHFFKPGMNFHRGFDAFEFVRGQERDAYRTAPADVDLAAHTKPAMRNSETATRLEQYLRNTADRGADASEYFAARVFSRAIDWLERNADSEPFFLWVDSFDPHEPWDPPPAYRGRHADPAYDGPDLIHPKFGEADWLTDAELDHVRGRYAEEVEFVDDQLGRLIERLQATGRYEETLLVVVSDHGVALGEHDLLMKPANALFSELLDVPLLIKPPSSVREALDVGPVYEPLVRADDVPATILDLLDLGTEAESMHGRSIADGAPEREAIVTGFHGSDQRAIRTRRWSLVVRSSGTVELYDREADPGETEDVGDERPEVIEELASKLGYVHRNDTHETPIQSVTMVDGDGGDREDLHARLAQLGYL